MDGGGRPSARWPSTATPGTATLARTDPGAATPAWWRFGSCGTAAQTSEADGTVGRWCGCAGHRGEDGVAAWRRLAASIGTATRRRHGGEIVGFVSPPMRRFSIRYTTGNLLQVITKVHNGEKGCSSCWIISLEYLQKGHAHQFG
ncbi:uncharacterized protein LOC110431915 isoform X3 [Sorghum bicolor]|uniref:uncharacterized protein LOC110431915 isoform X3 n=1 Tax=Sorghum bicolor TaxID=4558 RepID=UPI000B4263A8|nr:uncharacterized protein LOC110431915 isoform X3 [Sorghum bicolor]|eukprot:XP_021307396.1 uncharacterized protein LOC110431915 isoform X3 [Sorghum bicolor]